jgi:uncharacterized protein YkwD
MNLPAIQTFWLNDTHSCEVLMNPGYTEAGMYVVEDPNSFPQLTVALAAPYDSAKASDYKLRIFNELNKIRATGVDGTKYPGALCTSGQVAALKWNDEMAEAAQFHSDDYANNGVYQVNGSPHTGTKGEDANARIKAQGCTAGGGEDVSFNFGLTPEAAARGWLTMTQGHCQNVVTTQATVAGIGIAHSVAVQAQGVGPFVTFNMGVDTGCQAATKTSPSGTVPISGETSIGDRLSSGINTNGLMQQNQKLVSKNQKYEAVMHADGNFAVYAPNRQVIWASGPPGPNKTTAPYQLAMQGDGNLVIYAKEGATWHTNTVHRGQAPFTIVMQDDANLVLYDKSLRSLWATNTKRP